MNLLHIIGYLGADAEERYTNSGTKVWNLRVATRSYKNGQEETIWWRITVWGDQHDKLLAHFKKGKPVYIIAEMNKLDIYTDKNGQPQVSYDATAKSLHFVPMGENKQDQQQQSSMGGSQYSSNGGGYGGGYQQSAPTESSFGGGADFQQPAGMGAPMQGNASESQGFTPSDDPLPF
ncbi:MAG: single-stranded DNA-binding protein [Chlamydiota bacterium]|nr:single-stranded DNA-binding protein [Chlamydiota bacterium]